MAGKVVEIAYAVLQPHFDAVKDTFAKYEVTPGATLSEIKKVRFLIDPDVGRGGTKLEGCSGRHYAATRDDGLKMYFAPDFVELPLLNVVSVLAHEFGHSADHLYPGCWIMPAGGPGRAVWIGPANDEGQDREEVRKRRSWRRLWEQRSRDQIEWAADGIVQAVTGKTVGYSGNCMLQTFSRGVERPAGLR